MIVHTSGKSSAHACSSIDLVPPAQDLKSGPSVASTNVKLACIDIDTYAFNIIRCSAVQLSLYDCYCRTSRHVSMDPVIIHIATMS